MISPSPEKLKAAVQALSQVRAVEGPPGDNGQRSVWHKSPQGAELLSLVDAEGRVQHQELTLLEEHYVWTYGEGLRTGQVEREGGGEANPASSIIRADAQLVPVRLVSGAVALAGYEGEDRYILHMKRVLALAREGLELRGGFAEEAERPRPPVAPPTPAEPERGPTVPQGAPNVPVSSREGLLAMVVLGLGFLVGIALWVWLL